MSTFIYHLRKTVRWPQALLAEGRFYSDLELTEKEIERMVMETSRAEYLADSKLKQAGFGSSSTSGAEPSSSGASNYLLIRMKFLMFDSELLYLES